MTEGNQRQALGADAALPSLAAHIPTRPETGGHGHLWQLPDGTGLHAPFGILIHSDDGGAVCCHLCGRWFRHLGAHVRAHALAPPLTGRRSDCSRPLRWPPRTCRHC